MCSASLGEEGGALGQQDGAPTSAAGVMTVGNAHGASSPTAGQLSSGSDHFAMYELKVGVWGRQGTHFGG